VPLSEDLGRLEILLRQLQAKWEMFFSGGERKPPLELQGQADAIVRRYANTEIRNNGERFRFQSLTARYATFNELWQKRLRAREEGRVFGMHGLRAEQPPAAAPLASPAGAAASPSPPAASSGAAAAGEFRVAEPQRDEAAIHALYERYVAQRRNAGDGTAPGFDAFRQLVSQQVARIRSEKGGKAVDFRLETKDGKVSLKARVVR
jgi:hypothetical protein